VNDQIENDFILKLHNKTAEELILSLSLKDNSELIQLSKDSFKLAAQQRQQHPLILSADQLSGLRDKILIFEFRDQATGKLIAELESSFLAPHQLAGR